MGLVTDYGVGLLGGLIQFALWATINSVWAANHASTLKPRSKFPWSTNYPWLLVVSSFVVLPIVGGLLNRVRGGWSPFGILNGDIERRLVMAIGTALYGHGVGGVNKELFAFTVVNVFFGLLYGWGCYFSMGRPLFSPVPMPDGTHTDCIDEPDRFGMFDLVLGVPQLEWTWQRRWRRDMAGMALRGVVWMLPVGLGYRSAGFGSLLLRAGVGMGLVYELGYDTQPIDNPNFGAGTANAEFLMGCYWFLVVGASVLGMRQQPDDDEVNEGVNNNNDHSVGGTDDCGLGGDEEEEAGRWNGTTKPLSKVYSHHRCPTVSGQEGLSAQSSDSSGTTAERETSFAGDSRCNAGSRGGGGDEGDSGRGGGSARDGGDGSVSAAQRVARGLYTSLDCLGWFLWAATAVLTIWCAWENHPQDIWNEDDDWSPNIPPVFTDDDVVAEA